MKYILLITLLFSNLIFAKSTEQETALFAEKKITEYTLLAKQGDSEAQYELGSIYDNGYYNVPKNYQKAAYWYTQAANQDHKTALYMLGHLYGKGQGVKKDLKKAIHLIKRAEKIEREEPLKFKSPGSWFMYSGNVYDSATKYELELEYSRQHWLKKSANRLYGAYNRVYTSMFY